MEAAPSPGDAVPSPPGDEIDRLYASTDHALQRIGGLLEAYRDISDPPAHEIRTPLMHLDHRLVTMLELTVDPRMIEGLSRSRELVRSTIRMLESLLDISAVRARIGDASGLEDIDLSALEQLGLGPEQAVVVEDSESGAKAAAAASIAHIVTVSHFTVDDPFPDARIVVSDLGEPNAPAQLIAGEDVRDADGLISFESLERLVADEA